jgi:hypothetical protein
MAITKSTLESLVAKNKPKIGMDQLLELAARNRSKIEERAPEVLPNDEGLRKITERAVATTNARTTPECIAACISGEAAVAVYCAQILKGPDLSDLHPLTIDNIGKQWARQSIRCISRSVLDSFHPKASAGRKSVLPVDEAERLLEIVNRRMAREGGRESAEFWRQAKQGLEEYVESWSKLQREEAINAWR